MAWFTGTYESLPSTLIQGGTVHVEPGLNTADNDSIVHLYDGKTLDNSSMKYGILTIGIRCIFFVE